MGSNFDKFKRSRTEDDLSNVSPKRSKNEFYDDEFVDEHVDF